MQGGAPAGAAPTLQHPAVPPHPPLIKSPCTGRPAMVTRAGPLARSWNWGWAGPGSDSTPANCGRGGGMRRAGG